MSLFAVHLQDRSSIRSWVCLPFISKTDRRCPCLQAEAPGVGVGVGFDIIELAFGKRLGMSLSIRPSDCPFPSPMGGARVRKHVDQHIPQKSSIYNILNRPATNHVGKGCGLG